MTLITIPISHYCERARWALAYAGIEFVEERHLQGFAGRRIRAIAGSKTAPCLVTGERSLGDSGDILRYAASRAPKGRELWPKDPAARRDAEMLCDTLAGEFGVATRQEAYDALWDRPSVLLRYNGRAAPRHERMILRLAFPFLRARIGRYLQLDAEAVSRARATVDRDFDTVAGRLSDGRAYLCGEQLSAADLTFAALAAAVVLPTEYGHPLPALDELAPQSAARISSLRRHEAGAFALRVYRNHRK